MQASVKVTENGSFNVFNRSQEFRFTPEGFFRRRGKSKGPSRDDEEQLSFKVSPLVPWHTFHDAFQGGSLEGACVKAIVV